MKRMSLPKRVMVSVNVPQLLAGFRYAKPGRARVIGWKDAGDLVAMGAVFVDSNRIGFDKRRTARCVKKRLRVQDSRGRIAGAASQVALVKNTAMPRPRDTMK